MTAKQRKPPARQSFKKSKKGRQCKACGHTPAEVRKMFLNDPGCAKWVCDGEWCYVLGEQPGSCGVTSHTCEDIECPEHGLKGFPDRWIEENPVEGGRAPAGRGPMVVIRDPHGVVDPIVIPTSWASPLALSLAQDPLDGRVSFITQRGLSKLDEHSQFVKGHNLGDWDTARWVIETLYELGDQGFLDWDQAGLDVIPDYYVPKKKR